MKHTGKRLVAGALTAVMLTSTLMPMTNAAASVVTDGGIAYGVDDVVTISDNHPRSGLYPGYTYTDDSGETVTIGNEYYAFMDWENLTFEERAAELVSRMTDEEKFTQFNAQTSAAIPRLGIPEYDYWNEALNGISRIDSISSDSDEYDDYSQWNGQQPSSMFTNNLGKAATWNRELIREMASIIGDEGRAFGNEESQASMGLTFWSPTINLARDPRWGRGTESYSEDQFLTSEMAGQFVYGMQYDDDVDPDKVYLKTASTLKHFMANNAEYNRHEGSSNMDDRTIREYYGRPYKDIIEDYNVECIMTSYNAVNNVPMSVNEYMVDYLLRRTWGFSGHVVTDCGAFWNISSTTQHNWYSLEEGDKPLDNGVWETQPDTWTSRLGTIGGTSMGMQVGVDVNCGGVYNSYMDDAYYAGYVSSGQMDVSLVRLFTTRMKTGEFDPTDIVPYSVENGFTEDDKVRTDYALEVGLQASEEAIVMLKNEPAGESTEPLLPLDKTAIENIVILGEHANSVSLGGYSNTWQASYSDLSVKPYTALNTIAAEEDFSVSFFSVPTLSSLKYIVTMTLEYDDGTDIVLDIDDFKAATLVDCGTTSFNDPNYLSPNPTDAAMMTLDDIDFEGLEAISMGVFGSAKTSIQFMINDSEQSPFAVIEANDTLTGYTNTNTATITTGSLADADFGTATAGATNKLFVKFKDNRTDEEKQIQLTEDDEKVIAEADAVLFFGGHTGDAGEESDLTSLNMPRNQDALVNQVVDLNPNTVLFWQGQEVILDPVVDNVPSILYATYNGELQGTAAMNVIFGDANPSGRLPFSWYSDESQLPNKYDYAIRLDDEVGPYAENPQTPKQPENPTGLYTTNVDENEFQGRTYQYFTGDILYPFGHGLSYSSFEYSNLAISDSTVSPDDTITVTFDVTNTSEVDGMEVAQIYVSSPYADVEMPYGEDRPDKELKGFDKQFIAAGDTVSYSIDLPVEDMYFFQNSDENAEAPATMVFDQGDWALEVGHDSQAAETAGQGLQTVFTMDGDLTPTVAHVTVTPSAHEMNSVEDTIIPETTVVYNNQNFADLDTCGLTYSSNRESVATVDPVTGEVTAVANGVALITASCDGQVDTYAVVVEMNTGISDLLVNGQSISGFNSAITSYSYILTEGQSAVVTAKAYNEQGLVDDLDAEFISDPANADESRIVTVTVAGVEYTVEIKVRAALSTVDFTTMTEKDEVLASGDGYFTVSSKSGSTVDANWGVGQAPTDSGYYEEGDTGLWMKGTGSAATASYTNLFSAAVPSSPNNFDVEVTYDFGSMAPVEQSQRVDLMIMNEAGQYVDFNVFASGWTSNSTWYYAVRGDVETADGEYFAILPGTNVDPTAHTLKTITMKLEKRGDDVQAYYKVNGAASYTLLKSSAVSTATAALGTNLSLCIHSSNSKTDTQREVLVTDFTFTPLDEGDFTGVTSIANVPDTILAENKLALTSATVVPSGATNQEIVWSVKDPGTTGATITDGVFVATDAGEAVITATIANGATETTDYTQDFTIIVGAPAVETVGTYNFTDMSKEDFAEYATILKSNEELWDINANGLTVTSTKGEYFAGQTGYANVFQLPLPEGLTVEDDFEVITKIELNGEAIDVAYQGASIAIMDDVDNYIRTDISTSGYGTRSNFKTEIAGTHTDNSMNISVDDTVWLKLVKTGDIYTCQYSADGETYNQHLKSGSATELSVDMENPVIALYAYNFNTDDDITVTYKYVDVISESLNAPTTYTVTAETAENGTVTVDKATAEADETITVTATPDDGYILEAIYVDGVALEGDSFTMPEADVVVSATFVEEGYGIELSASKYEVTGVEKFEVYVTVTGDNFTAADYILSYNSTYFNLSEAASGATQVGDTFRHLYVNTDAEGAEAGTVIATYIFESKEQFDSTVTGEFILNDENAFVEGFDSAMEGTSASVDVTNTAVKILKTKPDFIYETTEYVGGYRLLLVYTNDERFAFAYGDDQMYNVSDAYATDDYEFVYGLVIEKEYDDENNILPFDAEPIGYNQKTAEIVTYSYDVNGSDGTVDLKDIVVIVGVYTVNESYMAEDNMIMQLVADVNFDKTVDSKDLSAVKTVYLS